MREGISYTVTLNFVMTFVVIVFAFISATLIYYKSNKAGNIVVNGIERYEGYNKLSAEYIYDNLRALGYSTAFVSCPNAITAKNDSSDECLIVRTNYGTGRRGYCIYLCDEGDYYYYRIRTNLRFNIPLVKDLLSFPIYASTNRMYNFEKLYG